MSIKRGYTRNEIDQARRQRKSPTRSNPRLRQLADVYNARGYDSVDSVRRAVEDLFPILPGEKLKFPGFGIFTMGKERLSFKISDNLRSLRAIPGEMSGRAPYSDADEEEAQLL